MKNMRTCNRCGLQKALDQFRLRGNGRHRRECKPCTPSYKKKPLPPLETVDLPDEEWRQVAGYEGWYDVSNMGRVKRVRPGTRTRAGLILKPGNKNGYRFVVLCKEANVHNYQVHRLVAMAFLGKPSKAQTQVNHLDGDRARNALSNLAWCTPGENIAHSYRVLRSNVAGKAVETR